MRRGNLVIAVLSALGAVASLAIAVALNDAVSLYSVLVVVLAANAAVRFEMARRDS
ncbi:MAG: hypothetical protein WCH13_17325 [Deltaproteobacteria bacterium]